MKDLKRALRRHHAARVKKARRNYWGYSVEGDARKLGILAKTPKPFSCFICCNLRRTEGVTRAELIAIQNKKEGLIDLL